MVLGGSRANSSCDETHQSKSFCDKLQRSINTILHTITLRKTLLMAESTTLQRKQMRDSHV
jgi:hypothetical protein